MSSTNLEMQKRIFDLEQQLYRANNKLSAAKKKCEEKNSRIVSLKTEIAGLRREKEKQELMTSVQNVLTVRLFKISIIWIFLFLVLLLFNFTIFFYTFFW